MRRYDLEWEKKKDQRQSIEQIAGSKIKEKAQRIRHPKEGR
jgi:hypothetical protein